MDIKRLILAKIKEKREVKTSEIMKEVGFSRAYVNRFFQDLVNQGKIMKIGQSRGSKYVFSGNNTMSPILSFRSVLMREGLREEDTLKQIKRETGVFLEIKRDLTGILDFAFTEMLNNAIDHSGSEKIKVEIEKETGQISFVVRDFGIGIFKNIKQKNKFPDIMMAIQTLLRGKQTTDPTKHTGQGIFFTSQLADTFSIKSFKKHLFINNLQNDFFVEDCKELKGTKIFFSISENSMKSARDIFGKFTDEETFEFNKTQIRIKLYKIGNNLISRSEAKRVVLGLDKFEEVVLDFKDVDTIGQGFADEIFRVWQNNNSKIKITFENTGNDVEFMIKHVLSQQ